MDEVQSIGVSIAAIVAAVGTLIARWSETNPDNKWFVRLAKVFDLSQVFDSTRKLND